MSLPLRRIFGVVCLACVFALAPHLVRAQTEPIQLLEDTPLAELRASLERPNPMQSMTAMEGAVDPDEYIVGPGDQFQVTIGGARPISRRIPVAADGQLILPEGGTIEAAERSLGDVQETARQTLRQQFANVPVSVTLAQPRQFYVHLSGAVPEPGRYLMLPIARVDDAIQQTFAAQATTETKDGRMVVGGSPASQRPKLNEAYQPSLRNVRLERRDGTVLHLDLMHYYTTGEEGHNPYLLDGDRIIVPTFHTQRGAVTVTGEVPYAGRFDYREGDTISDLLLLAAGPSSLDTIDRVLLVRRASRDSVYRERIDVAAIRAGTAPAVPLEAGDRLDVLRDPAPTAAIYGLIEYPGTYPIEANETTLKDLVAIAGGLKPEADVSAAFIERTQTNVFKTPPRASGLDFFAKRFYHEERKNNRIVVDVSDLLAPDAEPFLLRDGDRIVFPEDEGVVIVAGNVPQPGYVSFEPGRTADYYIDRAGGMGARSTGVYVIESTTGRTRMGIDQTVGQGETVFVNRSIAADDPQTAQLALTERQSRRQSRIMTTQTVINGMTAAISIIATLNSFGAFD